MPSSHGQFHWNELMTRNVEKAKKFYADTIGWTYDAMPMPEGGVYTLAMSGGMPVAGIFDISGPDYKDVVIIMAANARAARLRKYFAYEDDALKARMGSI